MQIYIATTLKMLYSNESRHDVFEDFANKRGKLWSLFRVVKIKEKLVEN
jgi:hypothetical protein